MVFYLLAICMANHMPLSDGHHGNGIHCNDGEGGQGKSDLSLISLLT